MNLKRVVTATLAVAVLLGGALAVAQESPSDWTTTLNVKLALLDKLGADSLHVDVDAVGGAVTLTGTVDKRATKELATTVAKSVGGVTSVNNEVRVEAIVANPSQSGAAVGEAEAEVKDAMLETRIRLALVDKMGSEGFQIGTEAASGVVTLELDRGLPADRRQLAIATVKGVEGVVRVVPVDKK